MLVPHAEISVKSQVCDTKAVGTIAETRQRDPDDIAAYSLRTLPQRIYSCRHRGFYHRAVHIFCGNRTCCRPCVWNGCIFYHLFVMEHIHTSFSEKICKNDFRRNGKHGIKYIVLFSIWFHILSLTENTHFERRKMEEQKETHRRHHHHHHRNNHKAHKAPHPHKDYGKPYEGCSYGFTYHNGADRYFRWANDPKCKNDLCLEGWSLCHRMERFRKVRDMWCGDLRWQCGRQGFKYPVFHFYLYWFLPVISQKKQIWVYTI